MLSRLASRGSYGWLFASGLAAGVAMAALMRPPTPPAPTYTCVMRAPAMPPACSAQDEIVRATAVIHFFDNEVAYATAEDPMSAKAVALLALPMTCTNSEYSYPALSRHIESAATISLQRGDKQTAMRLVEVGRAYDVDARMLDTVAASIAK